MTIEQLGSIGELVAAIATVATLGYLAVQIRGSARALRTEGQRSLAQSNRDVMQLIASNSDLARVFRAGLKDPHSLDPDERFRFRFLMAQYIADLRIKWFEMQSGIALAAELDDQVLQVKTLLLTPGGRYVWTLQSSQYTAGFQKFMEALLAEELPSVGPQRTAPQQSAAADSARVE